METFPKPNQPGWQDVTFEMIEEEIQTGNTQGALFLCNLRKEALMSVLQDIDTTLTEENDSQSEDVSKITPEHWQEEKTLIQKEVEKLQNYIDQIQSSSGT